MYYSDEEGLTYTSREHIFPAGLGGILKLPLGYVSDKFNNTISKLEQEFLRDGMLSFPREMLGPGKGGKPSPSKATKSKVQLLKHTLKSEYYALGYTSLSKVYEIPHLAINYQTGESSFSFNNSGGNPSDVVKAFKQKCEEAMSLKIRILIENVLPPDVVLIGIKDNIEENYNCFIAKSQSNNFEVTPELLKRIGNGMNYSGEPIKENYFPIVQGKINFKVDYFRVYGKMAFNFLAQIKGVEFVQQPQFDVLRNWIAYGGNYSLVALNPNRDNPLLLSGVKVPEDSHIIYLAKQGSNLISEIFLYGGYNIHLTLSTDCNVPFHADAFICDWKKRVEYRLYPYLEKFARENLPIFSE